MTSVMTNGVWSEILIDEGRVYFADAVATLTVLDVRSGAVVARKADLRHGGTLRAVDQGILIENPSGATLLDRTSLDVLAQGQEARDLARADSRSNPDSSLGSDDNASASHSASAGAQDGCDACSPWKQTMILEEADGTGRVEFDLNPPRYDALEMLIAKRDKPVQYAQDQTQFDLEDGCLKVTGVRELRVPSGRGLEEYVDIELKSSRGCWTGRLLHVWSIEQVMAIAATPERLLLGTSLGHVECIDRMSGRSLWTYVFGWAQDRMSQRTREMLTASAPSDQDDVRGLAKLGLRLEGSTEPPCPVVIFDPQPDLRPPRPKRRRR